MLFHKAARVTVYEDCKCDVCVNPQSHWSSCPYIHHRFVVEYACLPYYAGDVEDLCNAVDDRVGYETPHPECLAAIERDHPGCVYVYMDASDREAFRREVDRCKVKIAAA